MNKSISSLALGLVIASTVCSFAEEKSETKKSPAPAVQKCAIREGNDANPKITTEYEGKTYGFCSEGCRTRFTKLRADSLYQRIGGKAAVNAAVDLFYTKLLADERVSPFFDDVSMKNQIRKQKAFVTAALGGPEPWTGRGMRKAHKHMKITEEHFGIVATHLQKSLEELKVKDEHVQEFMKIIGSVKGDVLNEKKKPATKK